MGCSSHCAARSERARTCSPVCGSTPGSMIGPRQPRGSQGGRGKYGARIGQCGTVGYDLGWRGPSLYAQSVGLGTRGDDRRPGDAQDPALTRARGLGVPQEPMAGLVSTDLGLTVAQIPEHYGARWKRKPDSAQSSRRSVRPRRKPATPHAVTNHLNFCRATATITWI